MTKEYKKELQKEIEIILNNIETNYKFFEIYADDLDLTHIILKYNNAFYTFTLDINVSLKNVKSFREEGGSPNACNILDFEDLNTALTIINWWYN